MIETLLKSVQQTIKHEKEIRKIKGEDFNIFSIMGMEANETKTHSSFIAALLNPNGLHYKGDVFLKLFLNRIFTEEEQRDKTIKIDMDQFLKGSVKVRKEFNIGNLKNLEAPKDSENSKEPKEPETAEEPLDPEGGIIDILITSSNQLISIENKIYAIDQKSQLERYYNYRKDKNIVVYLTLDGKAASKERKSFGVEKYHRISYKEHIKEWLEECLKNTADEPILRESIKQYLIIVKKLTHQMSKTADNKVKEIIIENLEAAESVYYNYKEAQNKILSGFRDELKDSIKKEFPELTLIENNKKPIVSLYPSDSKNPNVSFSIYPFEVGLSEGKLIYGIRVEGGDPNIAKKIFESITNSNNELSLDNWWPVRQTYGENDVSNELGVLNLNDIETMKQLADKSTREKHIERFVSEFKSFVNAHIKTVKNL